MTVFASWLQFPTCFLPLETGTRKGAGVIRLSRWFSIMKRAVVSRVVIRVAELPLMVLNDIC
jgi:hypothetical protein